VVQAESDAAGHSRDDPLLVAVTVPKPSPGLQAQIRKKTADQLSGMGAFPGNSS
jgi:hypothetical protein